MSLECRSWAGLMCVVLLLVETTLAGEKRQVFNTTTLNGEVNQCILDDFLKQFILPRSIEDGMPTLISGECGDKRHGEGFFIGSINSPGVVIHFNETHNTLNDPSCIAMVVNIQEDNVEPLVTFYDDNLADLGEILLTQSTVNVTIRDSFATFNYSKPDRQSHAWLQLCLDGELLELYHNCALVGSQHFSSVGFQKNDVIGVFKHLVREDALPYYESVSQLYTISCSGPDIMKDDIVNLQCLANPPNCSENLTPISEVVDTYLLEIGTEILPTSTLSIATAIIEQPATSSTITTTKLINPTMIPRVTSCDCNDNEDEMKILREALIAVTVVSIFIILILVVVLIIVSVLWRKSVGKQN